MAPEAAAGGPLGLVRTDDVIVLEENRRIDVEAPDCVSRTPNAAMTSAFTSPRRDWERLYVDHVLGADTRADLDFLIGSSGSEVARESH